MSSHCRHLADLAFGAFGHQASKYRGDSEKLVRLLFEQPGTVTSVAPPATECGRNLWESLGGSIRLRFYVWQLWLLDGPLSSKDFPIEHADCIP